LKKKWYLLSLSRNPKIHRLIHKIPQPTHSYPKFMQNSCHMTSVTTCSIGDRLSAPFLTSKLEKYSLSAVSYCLFKIFAVAFCIRRPSPPAAKLAGDKGST
jgi:hypothetical protein